MGTSCEDGAGGAVNDNRPTMGRDRRARSCPAPGVGAEERPVQVSTRPARAPLDVTVVLLEEGLSSTAILPMEIFRCAGALWHDLRGTPAEPAFRVTTASLDGDAVRSAYGPDLKPCMALRDVARSDIVIVASSSLQWDEKRMEESILPAWLRAQYTAGAYVAGACMGPAYLAEAGILDGRRGTTHWAVADQVRARYPRVNWEPQLVVTEDARTLCSGGVSAVIDVSLYLVEKLCGHEVAAQCAKALMLPMPSARQSGYALLPMSPPHGDDQVREAEMYIQHRYREEISTETLAKVVGLGTRTFARRFKTATGRYPVPYLQAVRIDVAKTMFECDNDVVQAVCCAVGYEDVPFFRRLFKRATGMTPGEYRARFAPLSVRRVLDGEGGWARDP